MRLIGGFTLATLLTWTSGAPLVTLPSGELGSIYALVSRAFRRGPAVLVIATKVLEQPSIRMLRHQTSTTTRYEVVERSASRSSVIYNKFATHFGFVSPWL